MSYDEQYAHTEAVFGVEAEASLVAFVDRLPSKGTILDIGAGQGRNALFLARRGWAVHALEPSAVAAAALRRRAFQDDLPLAVSEERFEEFDPPAAGYIGIAVFGLTPDLEWPAIRELAACIDRWGAPGSLVWLTGFTVADPARDRIHATWTSIGPNSYRAADGRVRTYREVGQILELFPEYEVLHLAEGLGPEHHHGDGPSERHGLYEIVLQQPG